MRVQNSISVSNNPQNLSFKSLLVANKNAKLLQELIGATPARDNIYFLQEKGALSSETFIKFINLLNNKEGSNKTILFLKEEIRTIIKSMFEAEECHNNKRIFEFSQNPNAKSATLSEAFEKSTGLDELNAYINKPENVPTKLQDEVVNNFQKLLDDFQKGKGDLIKSLLKK